jgi:hypothetical protein
MTASSTFLDEVEKAEVLTVFFAALWSIEVATSMPIAPHAVVVTIRLTASTRSAAARPLRVLSIVFIPMLG